jgi:uroporphyrinogen-III synthase
VIRVAVTTTADGAHRVAEALIAHSLVPVLLPCIAISPSPADVLDGIRRQAADTDLIVVTSARAVRVTWPNGDMPPTPVAAVGPATAAAVEDAGGVVHTVGSDGAAALVRGIEVAGMRVVFPHARAADPSTTAALEAKGATVFAAPAYDTIPIAPGDGKVKAAIFGSPSAVDGWLMRRPLDGLIVAAMGNTTATALRVRGVDDPVVPARPGIEELASALAERINR